MIYKMKQPQSYSSWLVRYHEKNDDSYEGGVLSAVVCDAGIDNWRHARGATQGSIVLLCEDSSRPEMVTSIATMNDGQGMRVEEIDIPCAYEGEQQLLDLPLNDIRRALTHTPNLNDDPSNPGNYNSGLKSAYLTYTDAITVVGFEGGARYVGELSRKSHFYDIFAKRLDKEEFLQILQYQIIEDLFPYSTGTLMKFTLCERYQMDKKDILSVMEQKIRKIYASDPWNKWPLSISIENSEEVLEPLELSCVTDFLEDDWVKHERSIPGMGTVRLVSGNKKKLRGSIGRDNFLKGPEEQGFHLKVANRRITPFGVELGHSEISGQKRNHLQTFWCQLIVEKGTLAKNLGFNSKKEVKRKDRPRCDETMRYIMEPGPDPEKWPGTRAIMNKFRSDVGSSESGGLSDLTDEANRILRSAGYCLKRKGKKGPRKKGTAKKAAATGRRHDLISLEEKDFSSEGICPDGAYWKLQREPNGKLIVFLDKCHPLVMGKMISGNKKAHKEYLPILLREVLHYDHLMVEGKIKEAEDYKDTLMKYDEAPLRLG